MISRRDTIRALGALPFLPKLRAQAGALDLRYRSLGRTGRWVVPFGLGGAVCMQWATKEYDPPDIAVRAIELGINYLDCANNYGLSQYHYGVAFRRLHLTPDDAEYNAAMRERLYITSKTAERRGSNAVAQLRNTLSVMFGDGKGYVPDGAYLDCEQIHQILTMQEVDQIYAADGVMNALLDYRDGTNHTGLNPQRRHWIRHIGITGHQRSDVLMATIRRDTADAIDTVLTTVNPNDRHSACHENNVIPLARARGLGIVAMKVMSAGVFFGGALKHPSKPEEAIRRVGMPGGVAYGDLLNYALSTPGVACAVVGIGKIDRENPQDDQLVANLTSVLSGDPVSAAGRKRIEDEVASVYGTATNFFNDRQEGLVQPSSVKAEQDGDRVTVSWNTAYAGGEPIRSYNVYAGETLLRSVPFRPQLTEAPHRLWVPSGEVGSAPVRVVASEAPPK